MGHLQENKSYDKEYKEKYKKEYYSLKITF